MNGTASNRPLSSHPAFRWVVGLWFAALLGAGLFVMPEGVHATIRQALGIDGLIPGGLAGKAAVAAVAGMVGFLVGIVLALRVAALNAAAEDYDDEAEYDEVSWQDAGDRLSGDEPPMTDEPRRPFSPREYFGEDEEHAAAEISAFAEVPVAEDVVEEIPVEFAEFEKVEETADTVQSQVLPLPTEMPEATEGKAIGDLPLAVLTARLQRALIAAREAAAKPSETAEGEFDPVIAFLRREADRSASPAAPEPNENAQTALRSALERLSQVSQPK